MLVRNCFCGLLTILAGISAIQGQDFSHAWQFVREDQSNAMAVDFDSSNWETVTLPHTARVETLVAGKNNPQWQGACWYRKNFYLPPQAMDKSVILRFEGAMNAAEIWINGKAAGKFMGGYLPYVMEISQLLNPGKTNLVAVRLDNRDNPITGPKPLVDLDFNLYGGLFRPTQLVIKDKLHITDPILADKPASGGLFVTFSEVTSGTALVQVQTHVQNQHQESRTFQLSTTIVDSEGKAVASGETPTQTLRATSEQAIVQTVRVTNPRLWSPNSPTLYMVCVQLKVDGSVIDQEATRIGIRRLEITKEGLWINGEKMFLRGCNRHQEYPYIGNALSDAAQYRDARKIKEAGFDYVRLSHYPQSPAFLEACDELGIVVMNCLLGWQYFNQDPAFAKQKYLECQQLIRRDRNHPCIALWEVSLNESDMPKSFIARTHEIAHEEFPGDQMFTCGWTKGYDVFIQARQHGGCKKVKNQPCVISEYGDWEYFAQNAGLEQHMWKDLEPAERNSRQLRGAGEIRLLQQAMNFQEAHNDNLQTPAFGDGVWVMFDYNRGYAPEIEASGVMDIFRLPKFGYWFFRSQRDADEIVGGKPIRPVVKIASHWTKDSSREIRVFSNCDEVALFLNSKLIGRQKPDRGRTTSHLKHPPFTFPLKEFTPGRLQAVAFQGGNPVATNTVQTPGMATQLKLEFDLCGRVFGVTTKDTVFCHASIMDEEGMVGVGEQTPIYFAVTGGAALVGQNPIPAEAGIASILLQNKPSAAPPAVFAVGLIPENDRVRIVSTGSSPAEVGELRYRVCYTTDGTPPTRTSPTYTGPISPAEKLQVGIIYQNEIIGLMETGPAVTSTALRR